MREKEITELDIWNMDETGFQFSYGKVQLVITIDVNKHFCMIDLENHNYITSVEYIDFTSKTISLILLISRVNILYKWCQHNNLEDNVVINIMETGYANNDTG